jgi:hypothetical protein
MSLLAGSVAGGGFLGCNLDVIEAETVTQGLAFGGTAVPLPARIEAENYDDDGAGAAYTDTTAGNSGGQYRADSVDIETSSQGGHNVGWISAGEVATTWVGSARASGSTTRSACRPPETTI